MRTRYSELIEWLRAAAQPERDTPPELEAYLAIVRKHAYRVTDADVAALRAAGFTEDAIFEQTVSTSVAAGLARLDAGLRAVG